MKLLRLFLATVLTTGLCACGSGGGINLGGGIEGTGKPVIRVGAVTATNGLTIGGETFDTAGATVTIGGMPASAADLRVGMVALLRGRDDAGTLTADSVAVEEVVKGTLQAKVDANTLTVQGQTVQVNETTLFGPGIAPASVDGLTVGDALEIYGFVRSPGVVAAARIEREAGLSELRLIGFAAAVDVGMQTFHIGTQVVDYAGADTSDLPGGNPGSGQLVRVRGLPVLAMGELVATEVKADDLDEIEDNDDTEIEGFVTAVNSPTQFVVGGVTVTTNGSTRYEGGVAADVVVGVRVEVEGVLSNGAVTAEKVQFADSVRIEADVASVVGSTITLTGLPGLTVTVDSLTEYKGNATQLGDLVAGDHLKIRGRATGAAAVIATEVDEENADTEISLQGPVDAAPAPSDPTFSILGVVVDTTGFAFGDFEGPSGDIGRAAFFAAIAGGGLVVEARGDLVMGAPAWDEVEIESEDD